MGKALRAASATDNSIADQESRIARMHPDDPELPEARRLLDALRTGKPPRRVLDLTRKEARRGN